MTLSSVRKSRIFIREDKFDIFRVCEEGRFRVHSVWKKRDVCKKSPFLKIKTRGHKILWFCCNYKELMISMKVSFAPVVNKW